EARFRKALALADGDDRVTAHSARFLADITTTIRGDDHLAGALFERSIGAARRVGEARVLARSLLMAAWVPYRQDRLDEADTMFGEALGVARSEAGGDPWAEVQASVGIATVLSARGSEADAIGVGGAARWRPRARFSMIRSLGSPSRSPAPGHRCSWRRRRSRSPRAIGRVRSPSPSPPWTGCRRIGWFRTRGLPSSGGRAPCSAPRR